MSVTDDGKMIGTPCALSARICFLGDMAACSACSLHRRTYDAALGPSIYALAGSPAESCSSGYCWGYARSSWRAGLVTPEAVSTIHAAATPHKTATAAATEPARRRHV